MIESNVQTDVWNLYLTILLKPHTEQKDTVTGTWTLPNSIEQSMGLVFMPSDKENMLEINLKSFIMYSLIIAALFEIPGFVNRC